MTTIMTSTTTTTSDWINSTHLLDDEAIDSSHHHHSHHLAHHSDNDNYIFVYFYAISIVGTLGNSVVALVYWHKKDKQTSTFFILVLALSDLVVCLFLVPMTTHMEHVLFETRSELFCKAFFFLTTTVVPSSSLLMTAIAFDRYFCICMVNRTIMNLDRARLCVLVLLTVSVLLGIIPVMGSTTIDHSDSVRNFTVCIVDAESKYTKIGFLIMPFKIFYDFIFLSCVIVITFLYFLIYRKIYVSRKIKRKREILYSNWIRQAECGGLIHETTIVLNENTTPENIDALEHTNNINNNNNNTRKYRMLSASSSSPAFLFKNCCLSPMPETRDQREDSFNNVSRTEDTMMSSYRELDELSKNRGESRSISSQMNCLSSVRYDVNEQKIMLSVISNNYNNNNNNSNSNRSSTASFLSINNNNNNRNDDFKPIKSRGTNTTTTTTAATHHNHRRDSDSFLSRCTPNQIRAGIANKKGRVLKKSKRPKRLAKESHNNHNNNKFKPDSTTINSKIVPFLILIKDTRTAFILFVISILFIVTYLPSIMATHSLLPNDNLYILYLYFSNSALNPIIYSFMNRNFRSELVKLFLSKSKPIFSASRFSSFNRYSGIANSEVKHDKKTAV